MYTIFLYGTPLYKGSKTNDPPPLCFATPPPSPHRYAYSLLTSPCSINSIELTFQSVEQVNLSQKNCYESGIAGVAMKEAPLPQRPLDLH